MIVVVVKEISDMTAVKKGIIVGMGSVLTKDFPEYSIVGGNPVKLIRSRK